MLHGALRNGIRLEGIRESPVGMIISQLSGTVLSHNSDVASSGHFQGLADSDQ